MKKAIRDEYAEQGVEAYYRSAAEVYENPHFSYIQSLLEQNKERIDYSKVLDLSAGGGEVTLILRGILGEKFSTDRIMGTDPFTFRLYEKNTGCRCWGYSFEDIIKGRLTKKLSYSEDKYQTVFSSIICSFAMHLCSEKQLFPLVNQLFLLSKTLIIITPHKRPQLEELEGISLDFEDFTLTERGKKVFLKAYSRVLY